MLSLDPTWLAAAVPEGLVLVGPKADIEVAFEADPGRLERAAGLIAAGIEGGALAELGGASGEEEADLVARLAAEGALKERAAPAVLAAHEGTTLAEAVLAAYEDETVAHLVWTGDELLVLPSGLSGRPLRRTLRAFIAGFHSHLRLRAYAHLTLRRRRTLWGDLPAPEAAERAAELSAGLDQDSIHVIELHDGRAASVSVDGLDHLGGHAPHRLGPVTSVRAGGRAAGGQPLFLASSRYALPNLRFPEADRRLAMGLGLTEQEADLVARAEAVERYAAGDAAAHELHRASGSELDGAVDPDALCRYNRRQYEERFADERYDPEARCLWVQAQTDGDSPRWVTAESVFYPFGDPATGGGLPPASSSGVAAHTEPAAARRGALEELVERDAFMWHWVQRVQRERIDQRGLDVRAAGLVSAFEAGGHRVDLVNLTLDTWPVVLCAVHHERALRITAACRADPRAAAAKSLQEAAATGLWPRGAERNARLSPEELLGPRDHLDFYAGEENLHAAEFLHTSPDVISFDELEAGEGAIEELVASIGQPLSVDLSSPATAPFRVFRALVPGMIPISFGYDREPLGMERLAEPKTAPDGRALGSSLDLRQAGPIMPHPFA